MKIMKFFSLFLSAAVLTTACNSKAPAADTGATPAADTGLVTIQPELPVADTQQVQTTPAAAAKETSGASTKAGNSTTGSTGSGTSTADQAGSGEAPASAGTTEKKGWSKTAKGAVIGGVTGAAAGAVINKKNRGVGAVVGGVTGAAAGAVIGNEMDKKDGRRQ